MVDRKETINYHLVDFVLVERRKYFCSEIIKTKFQYFLNTIWSGQVNDVSISCQDVQ